MSPGKPLAMATNSGRGLVHSGHCRGEKRVQVSDEAKAVIEGKVYRDINTYPVHGQGESFCRTLY